MRNGKAVCGIDFGTSNSAIMAVDGGSLLPICLEQEKTTIPSALFFNMDDQNISYGRRAIEQYLDGHTGRLLRSLKSVLGSSLAQEQTQVGGRSLGFIEIINLFVAHIKQMAEQQLQADLDQVVMGRPVYFVDNDPVADQKAEDQLRAILVNQGFKHISFEYEPIAAAKDYETTLSKEEIVLVFDIGGGTSDFTLMRLSPEQHKKTERQRDILATAGIHLGGTDFDKIFSLHSIMPQIGYRGQQINGLPMPSHHFHSLATWHLINSLYSQKSKAAIRSLHAQAANPQHTGRLVHIIENQRGHELASGIEKAKIALTESESITLDMGFIERDWRVSLNNNELERAIHQEIQQICTLALETVTQLGGLNKTRVNTIFMTGGSTALPGFQQRIQHFFPEATIAYGDRFSSVVKGLGITAAERYS
ncbi:MAG: Hsp70 family protein [Alphaproteobacteria bacterium]